MELLFQNVKFENDFDLHFGTFVPKCKNLKIILIYILELFPGKKFTFWNFSQGKIILIYILEFFPGKKFTFWNFSQGKSLHFGTFPREKVYILELFPGKNNFDLHFGIFPEILKLFPGKRKRKVPKCKLFSFTNWNFLFSRLEKIFSRPNSGDKKMKFYILELFLNSGEDFQNIFHFKNFFF